MKSKSNLLLIAATLFVTLAVGTGAPRHSGVYSGNIGNIAFIAAVTAGSRVVGLDNTARGLGDTTNPARSTVNARGVVRASTPRGSSITARISPNFRIIGTAKVGGRTTRLSGRRIFR